MRMRLFIYATATYALTVALALPAPTFAALPTIDPAKQGALDTTQVNLVNENLKQFFEQFNVNKKATQKGEIKRYQQVDGVWQYFKPAVQKLRDLQQKRSEQFQIQDAQYKQNNFCEGNIGNPESCLYQGNLETIEQVLAQEGRRGIGNNDDPRKLVDNGYDGTYEDNLYRMQNKNLTEAEVGTQGWSSDYWALATGATAKRYQLEKGSKYGLEEYPVMSSGMVWHEVDKYFKANSSSLSDYLTKKFYLRYGADLETFVSVLSPAEKYDLLVGDWNFSLTKAQYKTAEPYAWDGSEKKAVETWMGICHGWAVAAYMDERPVKTITVYSPTGTPVKFYPDDTKALSVLKWANGQTVRVDRNNNLTYGTKFIGGRCNKKEGESVEENEDGVVTDSDCFDTNPGSWHISIVNQLGIVNQRKGQGHRTIIIDATFDYEVWNQPMVRYSYSYFNPTTKDLVRNIKDATVKLDGFTFKGDSFGTDVRKENYRSSAEKPKYVVGVIMEAAYVVETHPTGRATDSDEYDSVTSVRYVYDLEIDKNGKILGGEWYNNTHPDFLWTATPDAFAFNQGDLAGLENAWAWERNEWTLPNHIAQHATKRRTLRDQTPLKVIVDGLIAKAKK